MKRFLFVVFFLVFGGGLLAQSQQPRRVLKPNYPALPPPSNPAPVGKPFDSPTLSSAISLGLLFGQVGAPSPEAAKINQLKDVSDIAKGFKTIGGGILGPFTYYPKYDANRGINNIVYNYLGLVEKLELTNGRSIVWCTPIVGQNCCKSCINYALIIIVLFLDIDNRSLNT